MSNHITVTITSDDQSADQLSGFKYFWLKSVRDYRLDVHCARCLVGPYEKRINKTMPLSQPVELNGDLVYLCGVANGWNWARNFHAAAAFELGASFIVSTYNGLTVHFMNARLIEIKPLPDRWNGLDKSFTTCRNYQFAVQMSHAGAKDTSPLQPKLALGG
jgi:hypothetical protein